MTDGQNEAGQTAPQEKRIALVTKPVNVEYAFKSVKLFEDEEKKIPKMVPAKDKEGKEIAGKTVQEDFKRDAFKTVFDVPTLESLFVGAVIPLKDVTQEVKKVVDGKEVTVQEVIGQEYAEPEHQFIWEMIVASIKDEGKEYVDASADNSSVKFVTEKLDFGTIARKPKYERKSTGVEKELLEELCKSYASEMAKIGKSEKGIKIATHYFMRRAKGLEVVKTEYVQGMNANLGTWFTTISDDDKAKFADAYALLAGRMKEALDPSKDVM